MHKTEQPLNGRGNHFAGKKIHNIAAQGRIFDKNIFTISRNGDREIIQIVRIASIDILQEQRGGKK